MTKRPDAEILLPCLHLLVSLVLILLETWAFASCFAIWQFTSRGDRPYKIPSNAYRFVKRCLPDGKSDVKAIAVVTPKKGGTLPPPND
ncbi:hypothetical protein GTQ43_36805 [Nostoc sp. KVJ3]|uniref:hypothetical protein n=1 Tax=Nostoc sp. KVJ3 TaxID=457945 RepID=UPI002238C380|nr:hypothetical protein [Nostoc sp. KVJ3]MCW5319000.1 hypothetical protein [Nostoc sp. KVJ3]